MTTDLASRGEALATLRPRFEAWWRALAVRERRLLAAAIALVALALAWAWGVQPAWRTVAKAPAERAALDARWQRMQALAAEAAALRSAPPVSEEQAGAALRAATARLGEKGRLALQGDRAVLTLTGVGPQQLAAWLAEARSGARALPLEATLAQVAQGAQGAQGAAGYSGTVVLALGGAP